MNVTEIIAHIEQNFNRAQAIGLNTLIFQALREQSSVSRQRKELGFDDIPEEITVLCDELEINYELLDLTRRIITGLINGRYRPRPTRRKNNASLGVQAIDDQKQPALLSDY
ncbi:hypothetical protein [Nostoc sp.]|uniref:hypothetical protein n=1 Tax=Nostoc sp. TaxID=1180 RepID=UPI002FFAB027